MKKTYSFTALLAFAFLGASACTNTGNTASNAVANTNRSAVNTASVTNSIGNAANTVANAVSNVTHTTSGPNDFISDAAIGGITEVELGKLAGTKAANAEVKKFGQMMVTDHSKANADLKALASKKGLTLPADLDSSHKSTVDELKGKSGADFDRDYVNRMVDDHEKDVAEFERQSQNSADADVKAFATKTLPVLRKHLDAIKAIQAKLK